jgi:Ubiquitin carboxyl-terminal hydrolase
VNLLSEDLLIESNGVKVPYTMVGVLVHQGASVHSGHYFSYVKCARNSLWYEVDDEAVSRVQTARVLGEEEAYMVFFCRKDKKRLTDIALPSAVVTSPRGALKLNQTLEISVDRESTGRFHSSEEVDAQPPPSARSGEASGTKRAKMGARPTQSDAVSPSKSSMTTLTTPHVRRRLRAQSSTFWRRPSLSAALIKNTMAFIRKLKRNRSSSPRPQNGSSAEQDPLTSSPPPPTSLKQDSAKELPDAFVGTSQQDQLPPIANGHLYGSEEAYSFDRRTPKKKVFVDAWDKHLDTGRTKRVRTLY